MTLQLSKTTVLALAVAAAVLFCGASDAKKEIITLPAITIQGSWIAVNYYQGKDGRVTRVLIQEVTPNSPAARLGLRERDELIAIDGTEVAGMSDEQFVEAYSNDLQPNSHRDYDFRCYRGFLVKRERVVRFRVTN
jgi:membrane-associated protease RseP (regulator of RpoE activity)